MWINCPKINNVSGCFNNIINVYCASTLRFNDSITGNNTVNISGLFGLNGFSEESLPVRINISGIVPKLITDNYYSVNGNTTNYLGTFQNRKVYILDAEPSILQKINGVCRNLFFGAKVYLNGSVNTLDTSNVTYASSVFQSCSTYNADSEEQRKFVKVILPNSCSQYAYMFYGSYVLSELPICWNNNTSTYETKMPASTQNTVYMFGSCVINQDSVQIPADYFQLCRANLLNTSYMFANNRYITELMYNRNTGLLADCTNLQNVTYMFYGCWFLHKGIPNNLFGNTPLLRITSLQDMFADTSIFFDVEDESNRWMDSNTIAPLTNLTSVQELFYRMRIANNNPVTPYSYRERVRNSDGQLVYVISPDTFVNHELQNIRRLFYRTSTITDVPFAFLNFEQAEDAFCDSNITRIADPFIMDENNYYNVKNVSRMFGMGNWSSKTVTNLGSLVNKLKTTSIPIMANIAGNLQNTDITDPALLADFDL